MKTIGKITLSVWLVFTVLIPGALAYLHFKASFDRTGAVTVFRFTCGQFTRLNWKARGREFELNGKVYDIVSLRKSGDIEIVVCRWDKLDTGIFSLSRILRSLDDFLILLFSIKALFISLLFLLPVLFWSLIVLFDSKFSPLMLFLFFHPPRYLG